MWQYEAQQLHTRTLLQSGEELITFYFKVIKHFTFPIICFAIIAGSILILLLRLQYFQHKLPHILSGFTELVKRLLGILHQIVPLKCVALLEITAIEARLVTFIGIDVH